MAVDHQHNQYNEEVAASKAPYIIICQGRIEVLATPADRHLDKIVVATSTATELVKYYAMTIGKRLLAADTMAISDQQHWLMVHMFELDADAVDLQVRSLFNKLDHLEAKYKG